MPLEFYNNILIMCEQHYSIIFNKDKTNKQQNVPFEIEENHEKAPTSLRRFMWGLQFSIQVH